MWAWGKNSDGFLGTGDYSDEITPVKISEANDWVSVSSTGASYLVINSKGEVWGWGDNTYGQLGDGTTTTKYVPTLLLE